MLDYCTPSRCISSRSIVYQIAMILVERRHIFSYMNELIYTREREMRCDVMWCVSISRLFLATLRKQKNICRVDSIIKSRKAEKIIITWMATLSYFSNKVFWEGGQQRGKGTGSYSPTQNNSRQQEWVFKVKIYSAVTVFSVLPCKTYLLFSINS